MNGPFREKGTIMVGKGTPGKRVKMKVFGCVCFFGCVWPGDAHPNDPPSRYMNVHIIRIYRFFQFLDRGGDRTRISLESFT